MEPRYCKSTCPSTQRLTWSYQIYHPHLLLARTAYIQYTALLQRRFSISAPLAAVCISWRAKALFKASQDRQDRQVTLSADDHYSSHFHQRPAVTANDGAQAQAYPEKSANDRLQVNRDAVRTIYGPAHPAGLLLWIFYHVGVFLHGCMASRPSPKYLFSQDSHFHFVLSAV